MRIQEYSTTNNKNYSPAHKGVLDGVITSSLRTLDTNPMANAVGIDLFAMVMPRTYVDTKKRNKYAGAETFFREFTGTLIVCLSASYLAKGIAKIANKLIQPETQINNKSWFTKDSVDVLSEAWSVAGSNSENFVNNVLGGVSGHDGKIKRQYKNIDWENVQWVDEDRWKNIKWDDKKYSNIYDRLKSKESISHTLSEIIENKDISEKDSKNLLKIISSRVVNALNVNSVDVDVNKKKLSTNIPNLLRDTVDIGKDVFTNKKVDSTKAISKILKINKIKAIGALSVASGLGLTNQYINRKITEKRTGTKGFVGDTDYKNKVDKKVSTNDKSLKFFGEKLLASAGMAAMALGVMKVKSGRDFIKKLEFTGPVTSGNAIKTVYASTLIGRFMASDNKDELRETATRDYLGFLNWLVLGGFAAKGVGNLLDRKRNVLFNESKSGKGVKHWLNEVSLKSHNEIASKGTEFAKKNMWKINVAQTAGLLYSTVALGVLLPMLNIFITKKKQNNSSKNKTNTFVDKHLSTHVSFDEYKSRIINS